MCFNEEEDKKTGNENIVLFIDSGNNEDEEESNKGYIASFELTREDQINAHYQSIKKVLEIDDDIDK